ncbi:MAG: FAD-dependent oxidoreductase [Tannerellaceae bacterium]|jgi:ribulose 1,5-bisphosphate synthetase/thiazole synthase|nr:FAD-dependent oxidoreductase [Tannerellaceae bacterium]
MKAKLAPTISLLLLAFASLNAQSRYDLVIVGGNPGGITAARLGKTSVILERTAYIGGLPANGLGATDIATREATTDYSANLSTALSNATSTPTANRPNK